MNATQRAQSEEQILAPSGSIRAEVVLEQLHKILASETFTRSQRMSRFLRFTVEQSLAGRSDRLKEYLIGVEVYDKPETLDPRFDPIVRVEAGRLRAKLHEYYETDGRADPVLIGFPKRSYVPVFDWNQMAPGGECGASLAVLPFLNMSGEERLECFCDGLTEEVSAALARLQSFRVVARASTLRFKHQPFDIRSIGRELNADSVIEGSVRAGAGRLRVTTQLASCADGYHIWCDTREGRSADLLAFQTEISAAIVHRLLARR